MRKILSLLLSVLMVLSVFSVAVSAEGENFASGEIFVSEESVLYWCIDSEGGILTLSGNGEMPVLAEKPWAEIAFSTLVIESGITSVSEEAFLYETELEEVVLSETVEKIGQRAFYGCEKLEKVSFSNTAEVGAMAFYGCINYKEINLPETVNIIGEYSFGYFCDETVDDEFAKIEGVSISSDIGTAAENYAIQNEITFVDATDYGKFFEYEMLTEESAVLTKYNGCPSTTVKIPAEIEGINVTALGDFLFEKTDVENVFIPASIEIVSDTAFEEAEMLKCITVEEGGNYASFGGALYNKDLTTLIKFPEGAQEAVFAETVEAFHANSFRYSSLKEVEIPQSVSVIGEWAFAYSDVEKVVLSDVELIPNWCFAGCSALSQIVIPETVKEVGENAFSGCSALTEITLPEGIEKIGASAFHGTGINSVIIPQGVSAIGDKAFGYYSEADIEFVKNESFKIFGKAQTVAESYAVENGFDFTDISPAATEMLCAYAGKVCITVIWNQSAEAESYALYRKTADTDYEKVADLTGTVYYDFDVSNGEEYIYNVAVVKNGFSTLSDKSVSAEFIVLDIPKLVSAKASSNGITVKWNTVKGSQGYIVYRKTENSSWKQIADLSGDVSSFNDTTAASGTEYTYTVKAYSGVLESGCDYEGVSSMYLAMPTVTVANAATGVKVSWNKITGASKYYVYRKASGDKSWTRLTDSATGTSYTDTKAKSGTTYYYTVKAVSGSISSEYKSSSALKYLAQPKVSSLSNTNSGITVKWGKITGASGYYVYRKTGSGSWSLIYTVKSGSTVSYTDKSAKAGTTYYYTVRAYSGSVKSTYTSSSAVRRLTTPTLKSVSSAKSGITFKWSKVTGASGYYVYRKTGSGSWQKIATVKSGSTVSYLDKSAKKGTTYTYTVKAYYSSNVSAYNTTGLKIKDKY